nr:unnamed protein product [Callosobruchus analis]
MRLREIKRLKMLVESQWNNEISSLAIKDLSEKKWNKPVMLPLTKDVIKFRNHILKTAETSVVALTENSGDREAFKKLVDASLAFTILFNRRRIGDVQYLEVESYLNNHSSDNQTEFLNQLSESERALTLTYKRVVAGGKGSRGIVILFPPKVQRYINVVLEIRNKQNIIPDRNPYLFAYPEVSVRSTPYQWVRGGIVLKRFAKSCKIDNPSAMTSNRLRKQIATLMQIVDLDKNEYSQLDRFMGHTEKTHQEFYEITQDAYQVAKNLFDQGKGTQYRNKDFTTVDIDPNEVVVDYEDDDETKDPPPSTLQMDSINHTDIPRTRDTDRTHSKRVHWTKQQKKIVSSHFKKHIKNKITPKKEECQKLITEHKDILHNLD